MTHLDPLGRSFLTMEDNGAAGAYATRLSLDIEGNPLVITDARQNEAMRHIFAMGGRALSQKSCDAGQRWLLADVSGASLRAWDERGHTKRATYDAARRATHAYVQQGAGAEQLVGRTVYGEAHPSAAAQNLRGKAYQVYDGAGVVTSGAYDFKGNLLHGTRRLAIDYHAVADWSVLATLTDVAAIATAAESLLEAEVFSSATAYDALNRPMSMTAPDSSEIRSTYNEAGLLEKVQARVRGAATWTTFVDDIEYDAKGQRQKIVYGNGTQTTYTYDPETFWLLHLKTVRPNDDTGAPQNIIEDGAVLQNLAYVYDPVGNILAVSDSAQPTVFFDNAVVPPSTQYVYDALYRLIAASGREHAGGIADVQRDQNDVPLMNLPHANDAAALRNYAELYVYDKVGNILSMRHQAGAVDWTRRYEIEATSNRLLSTSLPGDRATATSYSATYAYNAHGSMTSMPHLPAMEWDHNDQMRQVGLGGGGTAYYTYDAAGQRVRKVWEHSGLVEERIYLGGWEVYRKRDSLRNLLVERETLHGMDGARRVVLVETKKRDVDAGGAFSVVSRYRFQLDNYLGSASLEVDETGLVIGYEEYHPYGTTAYASRRTGVEVSGKRYRYTGKERDEETGLYYHGARHLAPWLGRWTSADPKGLADGPNLYQYVRGRPIISVDAKGTDSSKPATVASSDAQFEADLARDIGGRSDFEVAARLNIHLNQVPLLRSSLAHRESPVAAPPIAKVTTEQRRDVLRPATGGNAKQAMWRVAASDPIAGIYIELGAIVSATLGKWLGFEQDPQIAGAMAATGSLVITGVGLARTPIALPEVTGPPAVPETVKTPAPKFPSASTESNAAIDKVFSALKDAGVGKGRSVGVAVGEDGTVTVAISGADHVVSKIYARITESLPGYKLLNRRACHSKLRLFWASGTWVGHRV